MDPGEHTRVAQFLCRREGGFDFPLRVSAQSHLLETVSAREPDLDDAGRVARGNGGVETLLEVLHGLGVVTACPEVDHREGAENVDPV